MWHGRNEVPWHRDNGHDQWLVLGFWEIKIHVNMGQKHSTFIWFHEKFQHIFLEPSRTTGDHFGAFFTDHSHPTHPGRRDTAATVLPPSNPCAWYFRKASCGVLLLVIKIDMPNSESSWGSRLTGAFNAGNGGMIYIYIAITINNHSVPLFPSEHQYMSWM